MRELAKTIADERARQAALILAIEYERQIETMTQRSAATILEGEPFGAAARHKGGS